MSEQPEPVVGDLEQVQSLPEQRTTDDPTAGAANTTIATSTSESSETRGDGGHDAPVVPSAATSTSQAPTRRPDTEAATQSTDPSGRDGNQVKAVVEAAATAQGLDPSASSNTGSGRGPDGAAGAPAAGPGRRLSALTNLDTRDSQLAVIFRGLRKPTDVVGLEREVAERLGVGLTPLHEPLSQAGLAKRLDAPEAVVGNVEKGVRPRAPHDQWSFYEKHLRVLHAPDSLIATARELHSPGDASACDAADRRAAELCASAKASLAAKDQPRWRKARRTALGWFGDRARRHRVKALVGVLMALIVVAVVAIAHSSPAASVGQGPGVPTASGPPSGASPSVCGKTSILVGSDSARECVGRISEPTSMPALLQPVLNKIDGENVKLAEAAQPAPTVTLVYMVAVAPTWDPDAPVTNAQLAEELEGVLAGQQRADETSTLGGDQPKVRVVVYNLGRDAGYWARTLNDLQAQVATPQAPVVAVAGLGPGLQSTGALAEALVGLHIPVFPSRAVADQLTALPADPAGVFRAANDAGQLAAAAVTALHAAGARTVQLVEDQRADALDPVALRSNLTNALATDTSKSRVTPLPDPITYDSSLPSAGTGFSNALRSSCTTTSTRAPGGPDAFFLDGSGPELGQFLLALAASSCPQRTTVLAGPAGGAELVALLDHARAVPQDQSSAQLIAAFGSGKFVVRFLGWAHPGLWNTTAFAANRNLDALSPFTGTSDTTALQDGTTLLGYDTTITAITGIRRATSQYTARLTPTAVLAASQQIAPTAALDTAAGPVGFGADGHTVPTTVPIVQIQPDGQALMVLTSP